MLGVLRRRGQFLVLDAAEFAQNVREHLVIERVDVATVGQHRDRDSLLGKHPQERGLTDGVAIVADHRAGVGVHDLPAEAPCVAEHLELGEFDLALLHGTHRFRG